VEKGLETGNETREGNRPLVKPRYRWILLKPISKKWIAVAEGRDNWRALVNAVMNLRVP